MSDKGYHQPVKSRKSRANPRRKLPSPSAVIATAQSQPNQKTWQMATVKSIAEIHSDRRCGQKIVISPFACRGCGS